MHKLLQIEQPKLFNPYFWIPIFAIEIAAIIYMITMRNFSIDEFESIHSGWYILNDYDIYEDFIQQKNPILYYILALVVKIFGESIDTVLVANYFMCVFSIGIIYYTFKLAILLFNTDTAFISVLLLPLIPWFALTGFEIRPDVPMVFFGIGALFYLYEYFDTHKIVKLIISAIFLSIAFLFLQKAIFWFVFFAGIFVHRFFKKEFTIKETSIFSFTILVVYCIFLIILSLDISLSSYFFFTFEFVKIRQSAIGGPGNFEVIFGEIFRIDRFVWLIIPLLIISILQCRFNKSQIEILLGGIWLLLTVLFIGSPADRYFFPSIPLLAICISYGIACFFKKYHKLTYGLLITLVISFTINYKNLIHDNNLPGMPDQTRKEQLARVEYVLNLTDENDYVYDGVNRFNLFRSDLDFVWLGGHRDIHLANILAQLRPYDYNIYKLIYEKNPKIISHYYVDTTKYPWILRRYERSNLFEDVYIRINNNTGFDYWDTYVDTLGSGSKIQPASQPFNKAGEIQVAMTKAPDPMLDGNNIPQYPYVGIGMEFEKPAKPLDLTHCEKIILTYKLTGPISMILAQGEITAGSEYRVDLPENENYSEFPLDWKDFNQPEWANVKQPLALDKITGVKFQINSPDYSHAEIVIKNIEFIGINHSDLSKWD